MSEPLTVWNVCGDCVDGSIPVRPGVVGSLVIPCPRCGGEGVVQVDVDPRDPWSALRAVRSRPLVHATTGDDPIHGSDAVDELAAIRVFVDAVLAGARSPRRRDRAAQERVSERAPSARRRAGPTG